VRYGGSQGQKKGSEAPLNSWLALNLKGRKISGSDPTIRRYDTSKLALKFNMSGEPREKHETRVRNDTTRTKVTEEHNWKKTRWNGGSKGDTLNHQMLFQIEERRPDWNTGTTLKENKKR